MMNKALQQNLTRREWLKAGSLGMGSLMLTGLTPSQGEAGLLSPKTPHFAPKAKRIIFMFMHGGPSQFESFDYKPELIKNAGKKGSKKGTLLKPQYKFAQRGKSGMWISDAYPHLAKQADDICMLNGMETSSRAHPLAVPLLHTGDFQFVRPSFGSWVLYGLGTENQNLPGFFTIQPTRVFGGPANYSSAFLPSTYQATRLGWGGGAIKDAKISNLQSHHGLSPEAAQRSLQLTQTMNKQLSNQTKDVSGVMNALELSQSMQSSVPKVLDINKESKETLAMYGINEKSTDNFGRQCLMARRLVESGVRFVELTSNGWDHHSGLNNFKGKAESTDKPMAALLADLKQRGLLDDTLVLWIGEFGRQPEAQVLNKKIQLGRDHNSTGFTAWLAGGGVKAGLTHGATDDLGYKSVLGKIHLHDLHATMLHLMGLDHKKLTYRFGGRDFRLTNIFGEIAKDIIA